MLEACLSWSILNFHQEGLGVIASLQFHGEVHYDATTALGVFLLNYCSILPNLASRLYFQHGFSAPK